MSLRHSLFQGLFYLLHPFENEKLVLPLDHSSYRNDILGYEGVAVVLFSPSQNELGQFSPEIQNILDYTETAFGKSAQHFKGNVRFAYFDLQQCVLPGQSSQEVEFHLRSYHDLPGFPVVIFYHNGKASTSFEKELTRIQAGVSHRKIIPNYTRMLNFLVQKNLLENNPNFYVVNDEGNVVSQPRFSGL